MKRAEIEMRSVPFLKLKPDYLRHKGEIDTAIQRVLDSGWYILGQELAAFESEYARFCGAEHCVGVGNGLEALTLSLRAPWTSARATR